MTNNSNAQIQSSGLDDQWLVSMQEYEGSPLALRIRSHTDSLRSQKKYSQRLCITLKLDKVKENGLPEEEYNLSLMDFDIYLTELLEITNEGITVLIETYGGERNFYIYATNSVDAQKLLARIRNKYPQHYLSVLSKIDEDWNFLEEYRKLYPW